VSKLRYAAFEGSARRRKRDGRLEVDSVLQLLLCERSVCRAGYHGGTDARVCRAQTQRNALSGFCREVFCEGDSASRPLATAVRARAHCPRRARCLCRIRNSRAVSSRRVRKRDRGHGKRVTIYRYHISMKHKDESILAYFARNLYYIFGIILVWRGLWYVLDWVDVSFFEGNHYWTGAVGVVLGLVLLYLPDGDLKEIEKL